MMSKISRFSIKEKLLIGGGVVLMLAIVLMAIYWVFVTQEDAARQRQELHAQLQKNNHAQNGLEEIEATHKTSQVDTNTKNTTEAHTQTTTQADTPKTDEQVAEPSKNITNAELKTTLLANVTINKENTSKALDMILTQENRNKLLPPVNRLKLTPSGYIDVEHFISVCEPPLSTWMGYFPDVRLGMRIDKYWAWGKYSDEQIKNDILAEYAGVISKEGLRGVGMKGGPYAYPKFDANDDGTPAKYGLEKFSYGKLTKYKNHNLYIYEQMDDTWTAVKKADTKVFQTDITASKLLEMFDKLPENTKDTFVLKDGHEIYKMVDTDADLKRVYDWLEQGEPDLFKSVHITVMYKVGNIVLTYNTSMGRPEDYPPFYVLEVGGVSYSIFTLSSDDQATLREGILDRYMRNPN